MERGGRRSRIDGSTLALGYERDSDPTVGDTDGDGLLDGEEFETRREYRDAGYRPLQFYE